MVCGPARGVAVQKEERPAEEEPHPRHRGDSHGLGHGCASAGDGAQYDGTHGVWVHAHGGGSGADSRDLIRAEGQQLAKSEVGGGGKLVPIRHAFRKLSPPSSFPISSLFILLTRLFQLLYASGFLFMGATEEHIALLAAQHVTHVSYILLIFSAAFLLFLFVCVLLHLYAQSAWPLSPDGTKASRINGRGKRRGRRNGEEEDDEEAGGIKLPDTPVDGEQRERRGGRRGGKGGRRRDRDVDLERAKGVEEFELEGLMSEEEEDEELINGKASSSSSAGSSEDSGSGRRKELIGV